MRIYISQEEPDERGRGGGQRPVRPGSASGKKPCCCQMKQRRRWRAHMAVKHPPSKAMSR